MIISETKLRVLDNSGALTAKCFRIYNKNVGKLGSLIVVSIQTFRTGKKVKKGEVYKGIVICTKSPYRRKVGNYISFDNNGVVLWKRKEDSPVGTRVLFHIPNELRFMGYLKLILISSGTF
jgi:large subunit ribosomal protein L14